MSTGPAKPRRKRDPSKAVTLDRRELAERLGVSDRTLDTWRATGYFPPPDIQNGRVVRWFVATVEDWERQRRG
jgi:predicted DNA-binding transcriptional regulator AlpA